MDKLRCLVGKAKNNNEECMLFIIRKFKPLLKKYSNKLNYDGSDSDLVIALIEIINCIPIYKNSKFNEDKYIVGYINNSIKHKYIQLSKRNENIIKKETELDLNIISNYEAIQDWNLIDTSIFINNLVDKLSSYHKYIIKKIYIYNISEADLAKELNISRQSVNRAKNRALNNLRKIATE
ncbi:RNA polymerase sigma factor, sigma-70 family protein [Clostridium pasteurianum DSM 525 = ATCC 6013]|uniref:RNA polymerase sigma factor, sigma-70 family protein n=1 Tax=Clostridium pasteurianum DSM 525 = ATCC 6013 TaxID=1262449 RepID=A0A0H3J3C1_CLOPA|nr:sigma factor-like helix-turn-helix DNA-binding protein [Clostridium pasteurianum]AJA48421.1 RNA polymerase sigma factor, sigma-70 family protein [Clostridium pasteurianum DSM 525 = ATCC 6013]AJA52409.1 RNA polymerase sigma factor, sigma-70 family protein [Clostridium pasteurianum DSM 525 = ATCC 6013]AOZ75666.1 RNA polymerase subunit sigma-70 [Clostridium pasteurianum DSM 525 = ATCC 6013]AOZ79462.1 RNA polymerase subunit sigma-70 [Clostridium pasteurianum]ELP60429.1 RNA polymerase sigma fact